jgi:hypothetical protein
MREAELRWLEYAWDVVNCPSPHIKACEAAGGAISRRDVDGNELRWPGYLGSGYEIGRGILCVAHAHREPTAETERLDPTIRRTNDRLVDATRSWTGAGPRSSARDQQYLRAVRSAYEDALPAWNVWKGFARLVERELGLDVTHIAYANLAKCRVPIERSPDPLVRLCQRQFPIAQLVAAIQPAVVLTCVLPARRGGLVIWDSEDASPVVLAWHGRNGTDPGGRPMATWVPEAGRVLRRLLSDDASAGAAVSGDGPARRRDARTTVPLTAQGHRLRSLGQIRARSDAPRGDVDRSVLAQTRGLMKTDEVRPAQARSYDLLLEPGSPMFALLRSLGAERCTRIADMTESPTPEIRSRARALMSELPTSHIWLRGICAYAVASDRLR